MEEKEKELNCWNHPVLEQLKREIATNKLHLNILLDFARKSIIHKEKKIDVFVVYLEIIRFGGKVFGTISQMIALLEQTFRLSRSTFTFVLSHIRNKLVKEYVSEESISPEKRLGICLVYCDRNGWICRIHSLQNCHRRVQCSS